MALYKTGGKVDLSAFMPILESLGLRVVEEVRPRLLGEGKVYIHDFGVLDARGGVLDLSRVRRPGRRGDRAVWRGETELDSLNRLVTTGGLTWREVAILRAYRKYRMRVSTSFTEEYRNDALAANPILAAQLVRLFEAKFDPRRAAHRRRDRGGPPRHPARPARRHVARPGPDRRVNFLGAIDATVRTNAFLPGRGHLSFKIRSADVPEMPKPFPLFEIFVYSPEMEATLVLDGVFTEAPEGALAFHPAPGPSDAEVAAALATIRHRVQRLLVRHGLEPADDATGPADRLAEESPVLAGIVGASVQGRVALGSRAGARVRRLGDARDTPTVTSRGPRQAHLEGFDLHANVWVSAHDRAGLERLCRYILRPPFAQERLRLRSDGRVALELKTAWHDGTRELVFEPLEFLERLAAMTPRPETNLLICHGVLAPRARWRERVVAYGRVAPEPTAATAPRARRPRRHRGDAHAARLELGGPHAPGVRH